MPLLLENLIAIDRMQTLFDAFYNATNIGAAIISLDGKILVSSGWQIICREFHRRNPESEKMCVQSDTRVYKKMMCGRGQAVYRCPHGLIDAAIPIVINDRHMGSLFTGQFLFEAPDAETLERFKRQASKWGFDRDAYMAALSAVPIVPEDRVESILHYLKQLSELIGEMGLAHIELEVRKNTILDTNAALKRETRRRLRETQKYAQILEGNPIPTFVIDADSKITHWNRACEMLTGIPAADMIGTGNHREAFYVRRRELMADLIVRRAGTYDFSMLYGGKFKGSQLIKNGYEGEEFFPKLGENGKWLFFTAAPLKDDHGNVIGAIETIQDITDRRLADQALRTSEARYHQLFEFANDAIFILKNESIVDCNRKALDLFKSSRQEMLGLSPLDLSTRTQTDGVLSKDEASRKLELLLHDVPQFFEWRLKRKDGSQFDAEVSLTRFYITGTPHGLAIIRDITGRKKMIQALEDRQRALDDKTSYLEKVNQALKASLDHREVEKRAVEESMLVILKRFVFPYIEELGGCQLSTDAKAYVNIIETNLKDIVSRFSQTVFSKYLNFTPTEVRIADFIRGGKNSKEIAQLLGLSPSSVQWHRKNIREKLGLTNKKVNLYTYLISLAE
ncbi:hypothetical protein DSCA_07560 [Desulfosarcina alkanivorans]|uniref:Histidine kinase n=1 Tax=Desulfosarcina alkanivorans TaxID=571177 RepID=A0A5K7YCZ8_9BACT|nr:PocR ligand-binding domain-containing protein [Desulfosarcina alkanivorans]BBO66826.1 hypothetical protein DSCA_07560 [Desulfosarcina alkanivorans]